MSKTKENERILTQIGDKTARAMALGTLMRLGVSPRSSEGRGFVWRVVCFGITGAQPPNNKNNKR